MVDHDLNTYIIVKIKSKGELHNNLEKISKDELEYLIQRKLIVLNKDGNYGDQLVVTGRSSDRGQHSNKKGKEKQRYTNDHVYSRLTVSKLLDYLKDKVTPEQINEILKQTISTQIEKLTELKNTIRVS